MRLPILGFAAMLAAGLATVSARAAENWSVVSIASDAGNGQVFPIDKKLADRAAVARWDSSAADDGTTAVREALEKLRDGDVLVVNAVYNATGVALGKGSAVTTVAWADFLAQWGVRKRPRLALVILRGAFHRQPETAEMTPEDKKAAFEAYANWSKPVTDQQLQAIGDALNALTIVSLKATDDAVETPALPGLAAGLFAGKPVAELAEGYSARYLAPVGVDRKTAALTGLADYAGKEELLACLCKCNEPEGTRFQCTYDVTTKKYSKSCGQTANGFCLCRANGCFRRAVPTSGACAESCRSRITPRRASVIEGEGGGGSLLKPSIDPDG